MGGGGGDTADIDSELFGVGSSDIGDHQIKKKNREDNDPLAFMKRA
jgi:hypothetical protein